MTFGPNQNNYNTNQGKGMFMGSSQCQLTQLLRLHCKALWTFFMKSGIKVFLLSETKFRGKIILACSDDRRRFYEFVQCECLLMHKRKKWEKNSNDHQRGRKLFWIMYFMYKFWRLVFLIKHATLDATDLAEEEPFDPFSFPVPHVIFSPSLLLAWRRLTSPSLGPGL